MALEAPSRSRLNQPIKLSLPFRRSPSLPRSATDRLWLIGGGVAAVLILLVSYVAFIAPQRSSTSHVRSQASVAQTHIDQLQTRIGVLQRQYKDLPKYKRDLAAARAALPATSDVSTFLRTLQQIGSATSTTVSALTVGNPTAVAAPAAQPGVTAPSSTAPTAQTGSGAVTPGQIYSMAISAQVSGSVAGLNAFLVQLQKVQPRAVLITQLSEATAGGAGASGKGTVLALSMSAFIAPGSATTTGS